MVKYRLQYLIHLKIWNSNLSLSMQNTTTIYSDLSVLNTCRLLVWEQWLEDLDWLWTTVVSYQNYFHQDEQNEYYIVTTWSLKPLIFILLRPWMAVRDTVELFEFNAWFSRDGKNLARPAFPIDLTYNSLHSSSSHDFISVST